MDRESAINTALEMRKLARTFATSVGVSIETFDGKIFGGFNVETYAHKGYHAEEVALIRALAEGYNGTDFYGLVEAFQESRHDEVEIFPACPLHCWGMLNEFTHPYFRIMVVDLKGNVLYRTTLRRIFSGIVPPAQVYPSYKIRKVKPKLNFRPRLPLDKSLRRYLKDPVFSHYCDLLQVKID